MVKQEMNFGPFQGTSFTVITLNRESNCRTILNSTSIHWRDQNFSYKLGCDVLEYRRKPRPIIFVYWVHTIHHIGQELPDGFTWSGERLTKKQNDIEASLVLARDMERHVRSNATKSGLWEKRKLGSARRLRVIYFIDPAGADLKETIWNSGRNWKSRCPQQCLARSREERTRNLSQSWCSQDEILMHRWSRRIYEKALMPKAMKIPDAKALANKEWKKSRKYWHGTWRKSETKKRWSMKQGKKAEQCT